MFGYSSHIRLHFKGKVFIRTVRTRSRFQVILKGSQNSTEDENNENEISRELGKITSLKVPDETEQKSTIRSVRKSKFQKQNDSKDAGIKEAMANLGYKDASLIRKELAERFQSDGIECDPEFIEKMVEESERETNVLKRYLKDPKSTKKELTMEEIDHFVDWLIEEGQKSIAAQMNTQSESHNAALNEKLNKLILSDDQNPESLVEAFDTVEQLHNTQENALEKLPQFLYRMSRIRNYDLASKVHLDKYSALYTISTAIKNNHIRNQCIYLCGKLLYMALELEFGPKMHPDPINEKFYIESLIAYEEYDKALELYNFRKEKDVKEQRFWFELGAEIYLLKGDIESGIDLIDFIKEKWGYINTIILIKGLKQALTQQKSDDALWFWEEIQMNAENIGIQQDIITPDTQLLNDDNIAFDYYNRIEPVGWESLNETVFAFIGNMKFSESVMILEQINSIDSDYLLYFIESFKSRFDVFGQQLYVKELKENFTREETSSNTVTKILMEGLQDIEVSDSTPIGESILMNNILIYLNRLILSNRKKSSTIRDLQDSIRNNIPLTTFDANLLLDLLLKSKSNVGLQLATEMLNAMNKNCDPSTPVVGCLPKANSHLYGVFIKNLLSTNRPKLKGLDGILNVMEDANIAIEEPLATTIIMKLLLNKQFDKALAFIEKYIMTDDPIAIKHISIPNDSHKSLWSVCLLAFYKSIAIKIENTELINSRQQALREFVKMIVANKVGDKNVVRDVIGTLLAYNELPTCIAFVEWYGKQFNPTLDLDTVIGIKGKLESRIQKLERKLSTDQLKIVQMYKDRYGLLAAIKSRGKEEQVKEIIETLMNYAKLLGYKTEQFNVLFELSDINLQAAKDMFEKAIQMRKDELYQGIV